MYLKPFPPVSNLDIYVSGDVTIHESAIVASGVILQAAPDSRIVIQAEACVGMGVIVTAYQGAIEIEAGAILGAGVLIVGTCKIGSNACIGAATTIFNASIDPMIVLPAGSLIGDSSRQIADSDLSQESKPLDTERSTNHSSLPNSEPEVEIAMENTNPEPSSKSQKSPVSGQIYINQLLVSLFPERQSMKRHNLENQ
jgi:carbon dioxide concentrating mechanism protein CcmN